MKVAYYSVDQPNFAPAMLRVIGPLTLLAPQCELLPGVTRFVVDPGTPGERFEHRVDTRLAREADLVLIQRGFPHPETRELLADILSAGKPVVYETDDDLRIVPEWHGKGGYQEAISCIEAVARRADLVTVATPYLKERYAALNRATAVLPNCLPGSIWKTAPGLRRKSGGLTIGYCGTKRHERDLELVEDALIEASRRHRGLQLAFMGCVTPRLAALPHARFARFEGDYPAWPRRLAEAGIDIAVVPLVDDAFNRCKSHVKFLEFGYLGIPAAYSDVPAYRGAVEDGVTGLLVAGGTQAWLEALDRLIADWTLRRRIGEAARKAVVERHLLEAHCARWLDAYRALL
jgi:glycosyltransferase involved in cell wall biosynthesis